MEDAQVSFSIPSFDLFLVDRGSRQNIENCERLYRRDKQADWEVTYLFDELNPSTSHVSCFLADNAPLKDDHLSVSEMWCVVAITAGRLRLLDYRIHRLIPVSSTRSILTLEFILIVDTGHCYFRLKQKTPHCPGIY